MEETQVNLKMVRDSQRKVITSIGRDTINFILLMVGAAYLVSISGLIIKILVAIIYFDRLLKYVENTKLRIKALKLGKATFELLKIIDDIEMKNASKE